MSNNVCTLVGNLGADVDLRQTNGGVAVANFRMATTDRWTQNGESREDTQWHKCVCWRGTAKKAAELLAKGTFVKVTGNLKTRSWEDKDGVKRYTTEVHVFKLEPISRRSEKVEDTQPELPLSDEEIPF